MKDWVLTSWLVLGVAACVIPQAEAEQDAETFLGPRTENDVQDLIFAALEKGGAGARAYLIGKRPIMLTLDAALEQAFNRNLIIQIQQQDRLIAEDLLLQRKAVFDPFFSAAGAYTHTKTFDRSEFIERERAINAVREGEIPPGDEDISDQLPTPPPGEDGQPIPISDAFGNLICVTVNGELVNPEQCALETAFSGDFERASVRTSAIEAWELSLGVSKLFSWGSSLDVRFQSTRRLKNFYPLDELGLVRPLSETDPIGQDSRFPWTSQLFAAFTTPLPFSRDFGPYGSAFNVDVLLTKLTRNQAGWAVKAAVNEALRDVDDAYWELVRVLLQLQITQQQQEILQEIASRGARLYREQQITLYDKAQIDTNLITVENRLEILWNGFFATTMGLVELLDYESDVIVLPTLYTSALSKPIRFDEARAFAIAQLARPELNISRLDVESSEILLKRSRVQMRPDIFLVASVNFSQDDRVLGYESWEDSLSNVFDPDQRDYFIGLTWRIPLGNRAVKSRLAQARIQHNQAQAQLQQTQNQIIQELNVVIADTYSTRAQILQTKAGLEFSELAYARALQLRNEGLISEFELLQQLDDLLAARATYIDALIDHRKTRAQRLAAEGVLAEQYLEVYP